MKFNTAEILKCCYCEVEKYNFDLTTEHIIPRSKGGNSRPANKRPCCKRCNAWRSSKPLNNWLIEIQKCIAAKNYKTAGEAELQRIEANIKKYIFYIETAGDKLKH